MATTTTTKINRNSRRNQKPNGENKNLRAKKERKKEKIFLEPSKCHANFALDFSSLVFKFLSRLFSRIFLDVLPDFFLDIFPDFFLDLFFDFFRYFFLDFFER